jgi:hypothetical protein
MEYARHLRLPRPWQYGPTIERAHYLVLVGVAADEFGALCIYICDEDEGQVLRLAFFEAGGVVLRHERCLVPRYASHEAVAEPRPRVVCPRICSTDVDGLWLLAEWHEVKLQDVSYQEVTCFSGRSSRRESDRLSIERRRVSHSAVAVAGGPTEMRTPPKRLGCKRL